MRDEAGVPAISSREASYHCAQGETGQHESGHERALLAQRQPQDGQRLKHEHSRLSAVEYVAVLGAMIVWLDTSQRPHAHTINALCQQLSVPLGEPCLIDADFTPETSLP